MSFDHSGVHSICTEWENPSQTKPDVSPAPRNSIQPAESCWESQPRARSGWCCRGWGMSKMHLLPTWWSIVGSKTSPPPLPRTHCIHDWWEDRVNPILESFLKPTLVTQHWGLHKFTKSTCCLKSIFYWFLWGSTVTKGRENCQLVSPCNRFCQSYKSLYAS